MFWLFHNCELYTLIKMINIHQLSLEHWWQVGYITAVFCGREFQFLWGVYFLFWWICFCHQHIKKQQATGRTKDGAAFPLTISVKAKRRKVLNEDTGEDISVDTGVYKGHIWVFSCISGLISFQADGTIYSCNNNFSLMLLGFSEKELVGEVRLLRTAVKIINWFKLLG